MSISLSHFARPPWRNWRTVLLFGTLCVLMVTVGLPNFLENRTHLAYLQFIYSQPSVFIRDPNSGTPGFLTECPPRLPLQMDAAQSSPRTDFVDVQVDSPSSSRTRYVTAVARFYARDFVQAVRLLNELPVCDSSCLYYLGWSQWMLGDKRSAHETWSNAALYNAVMSGCHTQINQLIEQGKMRQAETVALEAVDFDPFDAQSVFLLGKTYALQNRWRDAIAPLETSITLWNVAWADEAAWGYLGHAYKNTGNAAKAEEAFTQAVTLNSKNVWAWIELGHLALLRSDRAALIRYEQAVRSQPDLAEPHYYLGKAYLVFDMPQRAEEELLMAFSQDTARADYGLDLARAYVALGKFERAGAVCQQVANLDSSRAAECSKLLKR